MSDWKHIIRMCFLEGPIITKLDLEKMHLAATMERLGGNKTHTGVALGICLRTIRSKCKEYAIPGKKEKKKCFKT